MECNVYIQVKDVGISARRVEAAVTYILKKEKRKGSVSVHIVGDARMRTLNREHRGKDKTTDVLSFAASEGQDFFTQENDFGDIFLSVAQIKRQAREFKIPYKQEFARMLTHGCLHILGYDHVEKQEAEIMFAKQELYVGAIIKTL